jgi:transcription termination factor Rho
MVLADLRKLASQLGISDTAGIRKNDLIAAIRQRQDIAPSRQHANADQLPLEGAGAHIGAQRTAPPAEQTAAPAAEPVETSTRSSGSWPAVTEPNPAGPNSAEPLTGDQPDRGQQERDTDGVDRSRNRRRRPARPGDTPRSPSDQAPSDQAPSDQAPSEQTPVGQNGGQSPAGHNGARDDDDEGSRRRGRRFRDRNRRGRNDRSVDRRDSGEPEVREDDVLLPVAGILDVLDNYAFVRTSGYLSGPNDVYVSLSLVRKYCLRRGDAITGAVRQPRESEQQRQKFNPLVRVDTINGLDIELAKQRPEFTKLTPLYPNERLRLETEQNLMTTRVIDLVMPIGKGQRALIVSPPKAGKTMILQALANAITTNNPECHLMVVLVDERPEEVTDMQRSVKGEVIASTFDRPPSDHTSISELAIERAKRLVEMGHDVVVLLDSITRLGRAYNLAAPASGRILSGGVDSTALYPPKRFLGAARNIEDGGSLTIFATALVETGSTMDTVIFEEFKGTGNAELKLDRKIADKRIFPAIDINPSGTRKEELLLSPDELAIHHKLRRVLSGLESQQAIDLVLDRLRKTRTNIEFLMQVSKSTAGNGTD